MYDTSILPSSTFLHHVTALAFRFTPGVRFWEALRGLEALVRQSLAFFFSCRHRRLRLCLSSPHLTSWHQSLVLSVLLKLRMTLHSGGEARTDWHITADEQREPDYTRCLNPRQWWGSVEAERAGWAVKTTRNKMHSAIAMAKCMFTKEQ